MSGNLWDIVYSCDELRILIHEQDKKSLLNKVIKQHVIFYIYRNTDTPSSSSAIAESEGIREED